MATYTANLNLAKPDLDDAALISILNENSDKLDNAVTTRTGVLTKYNFPTSQQWGMADSAWKKVYVDSINGDDDNDGLTTAEPLATLDKAFELYNGEYGLRIYLASGSYTMKSGMYKCGLLFIQSDSSDPAIVQIDHDIDFRGSTVYITDTNFVYSGTSATNNPLILSNQSKVYMKTCTITGGTSSNKYTHGAGASRGGTFSAFDCKFNYCKSALYNDSSLVIGVATSGTNCDTAIYVSNGFTQFNGNTTWYANQYTKFRNAFIYFNGSVL